MEIPPYFLFKHIYLKKCLTAARRGYFKKYVTAFVLKQIWILVNLCKNLFNSYILFHKSIMILETFLFICQSWPTCYYSQNLQSIQMQVQIASKTALISYEHNVYYLNLLSKNVRYITNEHHYYYYKWGS